MFPLKIKKSSPISPVDRRAGKSLFEEASWPAKALVFCVISVAVLYGLVAGGHFSHLGSEISKSARGAVNVAGLAIQHIDITGHKRASREKILEAAGFDIGTPIMSFKADEVRARLQKMDWIETARVIRLLPDRVRIELVERKPFALWQLDGQVSVIDRSGMRLKSLSASDYPHFVQFVGKGAARQAEHLLTHLNKYPVLTSKIQASIRVAERRWTLNLSNGIKILLPEDDIESALAEFHRLEERYHLLGKKIVYIDMRLPEKITIRLHTDGQNKNTVNITRGQGARAL